MANKYIEYRYIEVNGQREVIKQRETNAIPFGLDAGQPFKMGLHQGQDSFVVYEEK